MENDQTGTPTSNDPFTPDPLAVPPANKEPVPLQNEPAVILQGPATQELHVTSPPAGPEPSTTITSGSSFLTGSQIQAEKPKLPSGIYIIAGLTLLGVLSGLFDNSQTGIIYTVSMIFSLMLAVGLVFRLEPARKFMVGLSILILVISAISMVLLAGLQNKLEQGQKNYDTAVSKIDQSKITSKQKQQLDEISTTLNSQSKRVGSTLTFIYLKLGFTALVQIAVIVYLTRPKIKAVFKIAE